MGYNAEKIFSVNGDPMVSYGNFFWRAETSLKSQLEAVQQASQLSAMVMAAWIFGLALARLVLEEVLCERGKAQGEKQVCPTCGAGLESKGLIPRQMITLLGVIHWERRVYRCPRGCSLKSGAPMDKALGLKSHQQTSLEVKQMACLLAVFLPFGIASQVLQQISGVMLSPMTIWVWVQTYGQYAMEGLQKELKLLQKGVAPVVEALEESVANLPFLAGADGVMVPFRPEPGQRQGRTVWREVKVAILTRLKRSTNRKGEPVSRLEHRRLIAVLGKIDELIPRLRLEALRQSVLTAPCVVWLSDGGRGLWRVLRTCFPEHAIGILDFYHAAQNLWKAGRSWLDGRTTQAHDWFQQMRHALRHGKEHEVLEMLQTTLKLNQLPEGAAQTIQNVYDYLCEHAAHIHYEKFKALGLPIGSGMVESACKWLIQQRFKGVGMRWSEDGFNHLLHLRLAWVNQRFDALFVE